MAGPTTFLRVKRKLSDVLEENLGDPSHASARYGLIHFSCRHAWLTVTHLRAVQLWRDCTLVQGNEQPSLMACMG